MTDTYILTGLQSFHNYDSFSVTQGTLRGGGGTGFINSAGGKLTITPSGTPMNPATPPTVVIDEGMNFLFSTTDLSLKFHNNSPAVHRVYNSTERHHVGNGSTTDSLPRHLGLFGRHWVSNYEHCLIHSGTGGQGATEIGPNGERNAWAYSSTSITTESFTQPKGIAKILTRDTAGDYFDMTLPDYTRSHFTKYDTVPGGSNYYYHLEYIEDKNGVRVYVEWEWKNTGFTTGGSDIYRWRIKQISVSGDAGTTKTPFITFRYTSWQDTVNSDAFH